MKRFASYWGLKLGDSRLMCCKQQLIKITASMKEPIRPYAALRKVYQLLLLL